MLISKIRQYSWLAVGLIALCLIGFLVQDATNSNTGMFRGNKAPDYATMYGEEVNRDEVAERSGRTLLEYLTLQTGQVLQYENGSMQLDPQTKFGLNEQSWTEYVNEKIIDKQLEELGLGVTEEELTNLIYGPDPHPY
ncbi:MAG TPA: SurA N-terminal domain-containing protein, partial [Chitinophagales bacterium]|nr:SurA N-terminal domain-containing protein [Chitinophagales bacterium]